MLKYTHSRTAREVQTKDRDDGACPLPRPLQNAQTSQRVHQRIDVRLGLRPTPVGPYSGQPRDNGNVRTADDGASALQLRLESCHADARLLRGHSPRGRAAFHERLRGANP